MGFNRPQKVANGVSTRWVSLLCFASFFLGVLVINRFWAVPDPIKRDEEASSLKKHHSELLHPTVNCEKKASTSLSSMLLSRQGTFFLKFLKLMMLSCEAGYIKFIIKSKMVHLIHSCDDDFRTLDKTISSLEMQLAAARAAKGDNEEGSPAVTKSGNEKLKERQKVFFVMGVITAFSSRKRRDSIRETWMPKGEELKKLEKEKGIIMRFVIGHSATPGGVLDRAIDAEDEQHKDFLRLNHIEGYHELSSKTQLYFSTAVAKWDADFYIKVDDDVHVNLG
ncbi:hypothetical protein Pint_14792 [Pistacia integerrima]|uniref:Uncharacterized protein n=1 Tax=Pistacia integerrima TaxID=434235 RepID=A0ACC0ZEI6_9ROSI|nr:hypothetical protein Pint_14792 [Pistacia integerrima]